MEKYNIPHDITVFGFPVATFPNGIGEAFDKLMKDIPDATKRPYYGIGECTDDGIVYIAAAQETYHDEGKKYGYKEYKIEKGDYLAEKIVDWHSKTAGIKDVFETMYKDERADRKEPSIEIYKDSNEMLCLVKADMIKDLLYDFNYTTNGLINLLVSIPGEKFNNVPYADSWTPAQLAEHMVLSFHGFVFLLNGPDKSTERDAGALIEKIRNIFLDFSVKLTAPDMVKPRIQTGSKDKLIADIQQQTQAIATAIQTLDLTKTCTTFDIPKLGYLTRLEAVHFVIAHTSRHIHQLIKIRQALV